MGSAMPEFAKPWIETPLIPSVPLSRAAGCNIFLKLENLQPSGSFKSRGVGNMMSQAAAKLSADEDVHFYCSSEGNAGLACATTAAALGRRATIVVPTTARDFIIEKLRSLGARVEQVGANWNAADAHLREVLMVADQGPGVRAVYVPPFDHPDIWAGASILVDEVVGQMRLQRRGGAGGDCEAPVIDAIVCNVGGGGLLNGVMEGLERHKKMVARSTEAPTKVLAMETVGAESLHASVQAGHLVTLPAITSIATSLGARRVSEKTWEWAQGSDGALISATVTDPEAALACVRFLDDSRILVEAACGATMATAYNGYLRRYLGKGLSDAEWADRNVVMIVCGGSNANFSTLQMYKEKYGGAVGAV
ncbi:tryptophan synthase beta subunit-like PLP-dependent enzyme [Lasiosphaeria ovina]|uniref:L-serine ammonia-lyase n=1 Tax=Lasiosphaeria ovina TaxID=92902 RepID=A0AAE0JWZ7_9PEZI|nr:tryptophan synthase beta subunit-like PLP-dependent enzyme [Lasiosphaeria ovina]